MSLIYNKFTRVMLRVSFALDQLLAESGNGLTRKGNIHQTAVERRNFMTANQIAFWTLEATKKRDAETERANRARESENTRSNVAKERETYRSNIATETETARSNREREILTARSNLIADNKQKADARYQSSQLNLKAHELNQQNRLTQQQYAEQHRHNVETERQARMATGASTGASIIGTLARAFVKGG